MLPVLVVFSVVLVIDGGFEHPLSRQHGSQSCGEYIVATTVHSLYLSQPIQPAAVYFFLSRCSFPYREREIFAHFGCFFVVANLVYF